MNVWLAKHNEIIALDRVSVHFISVQSLSRVPLLVTP